MKIKKRRALRDNVVAARVTQKEFNKMKLSANLYTEGNVSEWMIYAALEYKPKKADLE